MIPVRTIYLHLLTGVFLVFIAACGTGPAHAPEQQQDTSITEPDSFVTQQGPPPPRSSGLGAAGPSEEPREEKFDGAMIIHCPDTMTEDVQASLSMIIARFINNDNAVKQISESRGISEEEARRQVRTFRPKLSDTVRITFLFDEQDFRLVEGNAQHTVTINRKDSMEANWLIWGIKPLRPGDNKTLSFTIENKIGGEWKQLQENKVYRVKVNVNPMSIFASIYGFLKDNPKEALVLVIIPVVSFFGGLLFGKRQKKVRG